ncbi:MAG TPA: M48 family metallopeptidase [Arenimonas sp.]|nr:M48 family metallopeptidase [Arenimonas sp.]
MNFFERQERARKLSRHLLLLFVMAVLAIVVAVDLVVLIAFGAIGPDGPRWDAVLFASLVTLAVIAGASLFRIASLGRGGETVARELGGTPLPEDASDFHYRRLRNVVEEIAIASGVPVPAIYVLEHEAGINAFAAGFAPTDAVVAVTRGALEKLNRDELQGVIAHEFSHILNGDMRLNIRLMGLLFGILVLGIAGRKILLHSRGGRSSKDGAPILMVALGLMVVGYVGLFFGRVIKAAVSRQREFLADASAVQFTRQTAGIGGALKKIGGLDAGSRLADSSQAEEAAHMLFGDGVGFASRLFATHPPLIERIQALEPSFKPQQMDDLHARWQMHPPSGREEDLALGLVDGKPARPDAKAEQVLAPPAVVAHVGRPQPDDYVVAGSLHQAIPPVLQQAAREHDEVVPLLLGLLHAPPGVVREKQQYELRARHDELTARQSLDYAERLADLPRALRLPLAALALPALRRRPRGELERFMDSCFALSHADGKVDVFEYCLGRLLRIQVHDALQPSQAGQVGKLHLSRTVEPAVTLLAVLAQAGHADRVAAQRAYLAGVAHVFPRLHSPYQPPANALTALDDLWPVLDRVEPMGKELLLEGLVIAIGHDGRVSIDEAELLRAVCASLHMPLPPLLTGG